MLSYRFCGAVGKASNTYPRVAGYSSAKMSLHFLLTQHKYSSHLVTTKDGGTLIPWAY